MMLEQTISNYGIFYLRKFGDPGLLRGTKLVTEFDEALTLAVLSMENFLGPNAIGIAANQVGIQQSFFVWKIDGWPMAVINPEPIEWSSESFVSTEGCLSFPGLEFQIVRSKTITITAQDTAGKEFTYRTKTDLEAALFQHEMDHLDGIVPINNRNLIDFKQVR